MKRVFHKTSKYVTPMLVINGDVDLLVNYIWETSKSLKKADRLNPDFIIKDTDLCYLDPGGWMNIKRPYTDIVIEGFKFKIKLSHVQQIISLMGVGEERIPGYMRFPIQGSWCQVFVIMPVGMFSELKTKLSELILSDDALHANLELNNQIEVIKKYKPNNDNFDKI